MSNPPAHFAADLYGDALEIETTQAECNWRSYVPSLRITAIAALTASWL